MGKSKTINYMQVAKEVLLFSRVKDNYWVSELISSFILDFHL